MAEDKKKSTVNLQVDPDPSGNGWIVSSDNDDAEVDKDGHVTFNLPSGDWQFLQQSSPAPIGTAPDGLDYSTFTPPRTSQGASDFNYCGIYINDPDGNFSAVDVGSYSVKLEDTSADKRSLGKHEYCVMLVNAQDPGSAPLQYDPYVRDKGVNS